MSATAYDMGTEAQPPQRTLVVGLGMTGLSVARFLASRGVEVAVTDSREIPPELKTVRRELPDVALFVGGFDASIFSRAERIVLSPGVSLAEPLLVDARARGVEVIGDIELFARNAVAPVIGITGSNGKSTVTTLVGEMARQDGRDVRIGGNLGTPALDLLQAHEPDLYVLELSSFQLETVTSLHCLAATVLNISADHLDRYASIDAYADAKRQVYAGAQVQIVNRDDSVAAALASVGDTVGFGLSEPAEGDFGIVNTGAGEWIVRGSERWMPVAHLRLPGRHNLSNALAALALGEAAGFERNAMLQVLREFQGLPHRTQWVAEHNGVAWYNDSKATNTGAALAAVQGFETPLVLIAGGQGKGADFREFADGLEGRVKVVVLIGEAADEIEQALAGRVKVQRAASLEAAVRAADELVSPGDSVLLSPACASFDMFSDYQARGKAFIRAVEELDR
jgi:UDP-N-acetylmuramoylalanine--D-glutamate ligase